MTQSDLSHHHRDGFINPWLTGRRRAVDASTAWKMVRQQTAGRTAPAARYRPERAHPDVDRLHTPSEPDRFQVTWIGHTTFLVQHRGVTILTDPMFGERCSPIPFAGPRRFVPPGVALADLPPIDLVLVSHNHYDHLDLGTVRALGNKPRYVVPLRVGDWFARLGIHNVQEYDWWEEHPVLDGIEVHAVPAQHFSGRSIRADRNKSLWCGWVVKSPAGRFFFAGDTGYGPFFSEIGTRLGPFDLSIIPIGAYQPRWFMGPVHCDPAQAVQIHADVGSRRSIASHWGTFRLTSEPMGEPPVLLARARQAAGLERDAFDVMSFGETRLV